MSEELCSRLTNYSVSEYLNWTNKPLSVLYHILYRITCSPNCTESTKLRQNTHSLIFEALIDSLSIFLYLQIMMALAKAVPSPTDPLNFQKLICFIICITVSYSKFLELFRFY
jgi:hypothetical protein